jgi:hypothetical protein
MLWNIVLTAAAARAGPPHIFRSLFTNLNMSCLHTVLTATATCAGLLRVSCSSFTFRIKREPELLNEAGVPEFLYG